MAAVFVDLTLLLSAPTLTIGPATPFLLGFALLVGSEGAPAVLGSRKRRLPLPFLGSPYLQKRVEFCQSICWGVFHGMGWKSQVIADSECWETPTRPPRPTLLLTGCPEAREGQRGPTSPQRRGALPAAFLAVLPCALHLLALPRGWGKAWAASLAPGRGVPAAGRELGCFSSCRHRGLRRQDAEKGEGGQAGAHRAASSSRTRRGCSTRGL